MKRNSTVNKLLIVIWSLAVFYACKTPINGLGEDPYAGGKHSLGIVFERLNRPLPAVRPHELLEVSVRGLLKYKEELEVLINEERSEVISLTDSTLRVRVPSKVASGGLQIKINEQVFFGPHVHIDGKVSFDTDYGVKNGFNRVVKYILAGTNVNEFWILGNFTNFENEASTDIFRRNIHKIDATGKSLPISNGSFNVQKGAQGGINSMVRLADGKYMVGGGIISVENLNKHSYYVGGITRLNSEGSIDSTVVELINPTPEKPLNAFDTLPAFNAYLSTRSSFSLGNVSHLFATADTGVIAVGNFGIHGFINYNYSSRESKTLVSTPVNHIVRIKSNGRVDSLFGYNNAGANGFINGAIETNDGKIVIVGSFSTFNNVPSNRIVAFDKDGKINTSFNIGSGPNNAIYSITYNKKLNLIALAGQFTSFNGQAKAGVVLLNSDGSVVDGFTLGDVENRTANYAYVMNSGRVLVTGDFLRYNGIHRSKLLILESTGEALQEYNNIGSFGGIISHIVETTSSLGHPALLIGGAIGIADGRSVGNLFRLEIKN